MIQGYGLSGDGVRGNAGRFSYILDARIRNALAERAGPASDYMKAVDPLGVLFFKCALDRAGVNQRARYLGPERRRIFYCCLCQSNVVNPREGEDTCRDCLQRL
jgi:hypothetical protein